MDETKILETEEVEEVDEEQEEIDESVETKKESYGKKLINKDTFKYSVRDICESAILVALAIILKKFVKINVGETGGSINLGMLPLFIIALRQGWFKGFIASGIVFGLIACTIDGYGFHTYPMEYLIGFGAAGILGVFNPLITDDDYNITWHSYMYSTVGMLAACVIRFFGTMVDSMLFWDYTFVGAIVYAAGFVFPSFIAVCALFLGLLINILKAFRAHNTKSL